MKSTAIINPPQSAILGMHNIVQRPVVEDGEIVVRPMMYVALSYDHRIIDGKESVSFLKTIKELIEDHNEQSNLRKIESLEEKLINNLDETSYSELIKLKSQLNRE